MWRDMALGTLEPPHSRGLGKGRYLPQKLCEPCKYIHICDRSNPPKLNLTSKTMYVKTREIFLNILYHIPYFDLAPPHILDSLYALWIGSLSVTSKQESKVWGLTCLWVP